MTREQILVGRLLQLTTTESVQTLEGYKKWAAEFSGFRARRGQSLDEAKLYLFAVFVSRTRNDVHLGEETARDLMPWFDKNTPRILTALREAPVLVAPTCGALGDYFLVENDPISIDQFLENHRQGIESVLGPALAKVCLEQITSPE